MTTNETLSTYTPATCITIWNDLIKIESSAQADIEHLLLTDIYEKTIPTGLDPSIAKITREYARIKGKTYRLEKRNDGKYTICEATPVP